jgi:hypothetical protein
MQWNLLFLTDSLLIFSNKSRRSFLPQKSGLTFFNNFFILLILHASVAIVNLTIVLSFFECKAQRSALARPLE